MFPGKKRLSRGSFTLVQGSGRRVSSAHFSLIYASTETGYAVVVPKKVARLSVTRHRIKRRVMRAFCDLPLPHSLIVFPKAAALTMDFKEMKTELAQLLSKIKK